MNLCTIRKPFVWHRDEAPFALLGDHLNESDDNSKRSCHDDSERPTNDCESLRPTSTSGLLDPVDDGHGEGCGTSILDTHSLY